MNLLFRAPFVTALTAFTLAASGIGCSGSSSDGGLHAAAFEHFGSRADDTVMRLAATGDGGHVTLGRLNEEADLGAGAMQGTFVAKTDAAGHVAWAHAYDPSEEPVPLGVGAAGTVAFALGFYDRVDVDFGGGVRNAKDGDTYVVVLDAQGDYVLDARLTGPGTYVSAVAVASTGAVYVAVQCMEGFTIGGRSFACPIDDDVHMSFSAYVVELSPTGQAIDGVLYRAKGYDDATVDVASLVVGSGDDLYVAGSFGERADFGEGPEWSEGAMDAFVTKLDANLGEYWTATFGGVGDDGIDALALDGRGGIFVAGHGELGGARPFGCPVAKLADDGSVAWTAQLDDADSFVTGITTDGHGAVAVARTRFLAMTDQDSLVGARVDVVHDDGEHGTAVGAWKLDGPVLPRPMGARVDAVAFTKDGDLLVGGGYPDGATVDGGDPMHTKGKLDGFVAQLAR